MGSLVQTETVGVAQAAIHLDSGDKVLAAEIALVGGCFQRQWVAGANGIAKLSRIAG